MKDLAGVLKVMLEGNWRPLRETLISQGITGCTAGATVLLATRIAADAELHGPGHHPGVFIDANDREKRSDEAV